MLVEVVRLNGGVLPSTKAAAEAHARLAALSTSSDTVGVSFAGAALHYAYYASKFESRSALLMRFLSAALEPSTSPCAAALRATLTQAGSGALRLSVSSVGGGPGTETAGLVLADASLLSFSASPGGGLDLALFDLERSWRRYLPCLGRLFGPSVELTFHGCDVTRGLSEPSNKRLAAAAATTRLFLFSFVAHETAAASSAGGHELYCDLAKVCAGGTVFMFLDVRTYAVPVLAQILLRMQCACPDIVLCRVHHDLPATTLLLQKRCPQGAG